MYTRAGAFARVSLPITVLFHYSNPDEFSLLYTACAFTPNRVWSVALARVYAHSERIKVNDYVVDLCDK